LSLLIHKLPFRYVASVQRKRCRLACSTPAPPRDNGSGRVMTRGIVDAIGKLPCSTLAPRRTSYLLSRCKMLLRAKG